MDISIITSLYKSESFLSKYINRIERFDNKIKPVCVEFIIISNDISSKEEELLENCKVRELRIIKVPRETLYASWNRGIQLANSKIICFWNVDDARYYKAILAGFKELMKSNDVVYFNYLIYGWIKINKLGYLTTRRILPIIKYIKPILYNKDLFLSGLYCGPFFMFTKKAIELNGNFDESFKIAGDFDWCARAAFNNLSFKKVSKCAGVFFIHNINLSGSYNNLHTTENIRVIDKCSK